jgi:hypothetical protein
MTSSLREFRILFRPEDHLGQTLAIAQVDKNDSAMIPRHMDPAGERYLLADVPFPQFVAVMGPVHEGPHSGRGNESRKSGGG